MSLETAMRRGWCFVVVVVAVVGEDAVGAADADADAVAAAMREVKTERLERRADDRVGEAGGIIVSGISSFLFYACCFWIEGMSAVGGKIDKSSLAQHRIAH